MDIQPHATLDSPLIEKCVGEINNESEKMTVWDSEQIGGTRAFALFLKTYAELFEKGYAHPYVGWDQSNGNKVSIVYLYDETRQQVAGGIAFEYRPVPKEGWIILSFTDPSYRGKRINQLLHRYFEGSVKARGGNRIASHIHVTNHARLKAAERAGLRPEYYRMAKWITNN